MKDKEQKVMLGVGCVEVSTAWTGAKITFTAWRNDIKRIAVIEINEPYQLTYIREQLDAVEAGWRKRLDSDACKIRNIARPSSCDSECTQASDAGDANG